MRVWRREGTVLPSVLVTRVTLGRGLSVPLAREKEKRSVISYLPRPACLHWKGAAALVIVVKAVLEALKVGLGCARCRLFSEQQPSLGSILRCLLQLNLHPRRHVDYRSAPGFYLQQSRR
ncbi:hypothetical protein CDAR_603111 [Caerostris darwini]|uniref:Uncharacterized protein n=1 Tax=Caerostris darwini TaxID=1538125 RepID=A0AAV4W711_9ARAC|nr:hypothetical protein CDAR_603111 [Caerostris darwini]